jgi:hypothetical protein
MSSKAESPEAYRARMRAGEQAGKPKGKGDRFAPLNAIATGGHLARLTSPEKSVWIVLFCLADRSGILRASGTTIAERAGMRREHAHRATKSLERKGYIECIERGRTVGRTGERTANVFRLLAPVPPPPNSAS